MGDAIGYCGACGFLHDRGAGALQCSAAQKRGQICMQRKGVDHANTCQDGEEILHVNLDVFWDVGQTFGENC